MGRAKYIVAAVALLSSATAQQYKGVNIGGWLVLESWITPSLYSAYNVSSGLGEWQFCEQLGAAVALQALTQHWDTWLQQSHLQTFAAAGVTHIRIPIGYWILGGDFIAPGEPYVAGGWYYLQRALSWATQAGLRVIVDLHGAPGSQNGHDNSGKSGGVIEWDTPNNIARTVSVLTALAANLTAMRSDPAYASIAGIELLNEPWTTAIGGPISMDTLRSFFLNATDAVRGTGFTGDVWISDGWNLSYAGWVGFLAPPTYSDIYIDTHIYTCFGGWDQWSQWQLLAQMCAVQAPRLRGQTDTDWLVVGEWSLCHPNEPSPPYAGDDLMYMRALAEAQMAAFGATGSDGGAVKGAFFWNFRTEQSTSWDYLLGLSQGYVPLLNGSLPATTLDCSVFAA